MLVNRVIGKTSHHSFLPFLSSHSPDTDACHADHVQRWASKSRIASMVVEYIFDQGACYSRFLRRDDDDE